jgi:hypothetical protein
VDGEDSWLVFTTGEVVEAGISMEFIIFMWDWRFFSMIEIEYGGW